MWEKSSLGVELVHGPNGSDDQRIAVSHFTDGLTPAIANLTVSEATQLRAAVDEAIRVASRPDGGNRAWSVQAA